MGGGPSQLDTFDPKPDAPAEVRGPFGSIRPARPACGSANCCPSTRRSPTSSRVLRSVTHHDSNHPDAAHLVQTGYHEKNVQFRGQIYPAQGSVVAKMRGPNRPGMPPYVCIPDAYFARQGFFQLATYLGKEFDPVNSGGEPTFRFTPPGPSFALPADMTVDARRGPARTAAADSTRLCKRPSRRSAAWTRRTSGRSTSSRARPRRQAFDLSREPAAAAASGTATTRGAAVRCSRGGWSRRASRS